MYHLYSSPGTGGMIIELLLKLSGLPHEVDFFDYEKLSQNKKYLELNPLHQVPTMRLPNGELMTESLAMAYYLNSKANMGLIPDVNDKTYPAFLRWSVFLVASIYPTFTYSDDTSRWVEGEVSQELLRFKIDEFRKTMWMQMHNATSQDGPWILGSSKSIIDFYLAVMTNWRPGRDWFKGNAPSLFEISGRIGRSPELESVFAINK